MHASLTYLSQTPDDYSLYYDAKTGQLKTFDQDTLLYTFQHLEANCDPDIHFHPTQKVAYVFDRYYHELTLLYYDGEGEFHHWYTCPSILAGAEGLRKVTEKALIFDERHYLNLLPDASLADFPA